VALILDGNALSAFAEGDSALEWIIEREPGAGAAGGCLG